MDQAFDPLRRGGRSSQTAWTFITVSTSLHRYAVAMQWLHWSKVPLMLLAVGVVTFTLASSWGGAVPPSAVSKTNVAHTEATAPVKPEQTQRRQITAAPQAAPSDPAGIAQRGVYLTANVAGNAQRLDKAISNSLAFGFNAIVIDVKDNGGTLGYASNVPLAQQLDAVSVRYDLAKLVEKVRAKGLYFIARLVVFSDPKLARHQGRSDEWVSANNGDAVAYNLAVADEVAGYGVDEIQFDYVRFPDDGPLGQSYAQRNAAVVNFLQQAQKRLSGRVRLSADVFGRTLWDWNPKGSDPIGQVLERMAPYVDALSPMIYPSHYERYFQGRPHEVVKRGMTVGLERELPLRPFLQAFDWRIPPGMSYTQYIRDQLKALAELGVRGYLFWNPRGDYDALWAALAGR